MKTPPVKAPLATTLLLAIGGTALGQSPLQVLTGSGGVPCEQFGHGLAMSGSRMVVGAAAAPDDPTTACATGPGAVYVFDRTGAASWVQTQRLVGSDGAEWDEFGNSVALSGNRIVVGAEHHDGWGGVNSGAAYVFELQKGSWVEVAKLEASDARPRHFFARSVAVSGDWIVCGTRFDDTLGNRAGAAYTFHRDASGAWVETQKLLASDGTSPDLFGNSSAIEGSTIVIGAYYKDLGGLGKQGAAYVYELQGSSWVETRKLLPTPLSSGPPAEFGRSVSIHAGRILVGARSDGGPGAAYVFEKGTDWVQTAKLTGSQPGLVGQFGESVSIHGSTAIVGARLVDGAKGRAFFFEELEGSWVETAMLLSHNPDVPAWFGYNVAISSGAAAVGAPFDLGAGGSVSVYSVPGGDVLAETYCTAGTSASGCMALIDADGVASASASSGFELLASQVEGAKDGTFLFGISGRQANPWGNGTSYQCVVPPLARAGPLTGRGTTGLCDGSFAQDMNALWCPSCPLWAKNPGPGSLAQAQLWYRDPQSTSSQTTSLSNALEFLVTP